MNQLPMPNGTDKLGMGGGHFNLIGRFGILR